MSHETSSSPIWHEREVFYIGGQYVEDAQGNHSLQGQMYVERLTPQHPIQGLPPLVFIHGATRSGTDWLTKPDGGPGWAAYFLSKGYECYLTDQPFRGRSPWHPESVLGEMVTFSAELIESMFTACNQHKRWPQSTLHTEWPGTGVMGDPVFDQFFASALPILNDSIAQERASQLACAALLDRIGQPAVLLGHSAGAPVPWLTADIRKVRAIVGIEPAGPPFFKIGMKPGPGILFGVSNAPITYNPPIEDETKPENYLKPMLVEGPVDGLTVACRLQDDKDGNKPRTLVNLVDVPCLVVTAEASYHAEYDWGIVAYLRQAGVRRVEHMQLGERGIRGNGHMMMLERNSDRVAAEIEEWLRSI